jgi:predicted small lipoprotein YifL
VVSGRYWLAVAVAVATLAGCGQSTPATSTAAVTSPPPSIGVPAVPHANDHGSVTTPDGRFVAYPDGLVVRFLSAQETTVGSTVQPGNVLIKVTIQVENASPVALPISGNIYMRVYYGSARYSADIADSTKSIMDPAPTQVGPSSQLVLWQTFSVPKAEVPSITVSPSEWLLGTTHTPYTFTDVGSVVTPVS